MFSPTAAFVRFRGVQNASTETQFNGVNGTVPDGVGKGGKLGRGRVQSLSWAMRSFFVSRNAFFFTSVRVLFNCKRISILYKSMS